MKRIFLGCLIVMSILMVSCERPRGSAAACFNTSKTPTGLTDTLYLLNCSLNYDKFKWIIPSYMYVDSLNKHLKFVPSATGNLDITLLVYNLDSTSANLITKTITVQ